MSARITEEPGGYVVECDECMEAFSVILHSEAQALVEIHSAPGHKDAA